MNTQATSVIKQTKAWLEEIVIGLQLCPFAAQPFSKNQVEFIVCPEQDNENRLQALVATLEQLDANVDIETSLLIFPDPDLTFDNYLDLLALANAVIDECGYNGHYQLASFHPDYQFEGTAINDASNYTNRSPYPMLHCLRETSIEKALAAYPDPENIPARNIKRTRTLGTKYMQRKLGKL